MAWSFSSLVQSLIPLLLWGPIVCWSQTYEDVLALYEDKFNTSVYNTNVRPLNNQSDVIEVGVSVELVSIVKVDELTYSFTCNAFLSLFWTDERLTWDPDAYGQTTVIYPPLESVWRPRILLMNTLDRRDIFHDEDTPLVAFYWGLVVWSPGSVFPISCSLDLTKYPFDEQTCVIWLLSMKEGSLRQIFTAPTDVVETRFFIPNGEWAYVGSNVTAAIKAVGDGKTSKASDIMISIRIRRRPTTLVLNIILPVVFLSLLNILVFAIPVESGEKISYGVTVLTALIVFLSIVSSMLPRSSDSLPYVIIYLFALFVTSGISVMLSIAVVLLHHKDMSDDMSTSSDHYSKTTTNGSLKNNRLSETPQHLSTENLASLYSLDSAIPDAGTNATKIKAETRHAQVQPYRRIGKYLNAISFVSALVLWVAMTAAFFIIVAT